MLQCIIRRGNFIMAGLMVRRSDKIQLVACRGFSNSGGYLFVRIRTVIRYSWMFEGNRLFNLQGCWKVFEEGKGTMLEQMCNSVSILLHIILSTLMTLSFYSSLSMIYCLQSSFDLSCQIRNGSYYRTLCQLFIPFLFYLNNFLQI